MSKKQEIKIGSATRTSEGLRDVLFDELDSIRNGKSSPQKATAVAKLAGEICATVRMEMDYYRMIGSKTGKTTAVPLGNPLKLGHA